MTITNSTVVINKRERIVLSVIFCVYLIALLYFLLFAEGFGRLSVRPDYRYNLTLFQEIRRYILYWKKIGWQLAALNLFGNLLAFVPFGFLVALIGCSRPRFWKAFVASFGLSLAIELTQLLAKIGSCDVDDLFLNTLGGILGYLAYKVWVHIWKKKHKE